MNNLRVFWDDFGGFSTIFRGAFQGISGSLIGLQVHFKKVSGKLLRTKVSVMFKGVPESFRRFSGYSPEAPWIYWTLFFTPLLGEYANWLHRELLETSLKPTEVSGSTINRTHDTPWSVYKNPQSLWKIQRAPKTPWNLPITLWYVLEALLKATEMHLKFIKPSGAPKKVSKTLFFKALLKLLEPFLNPLEILKMGPMFKNLTFVKGFFI